MRKALFLVVIQTVCLLAQLPEPGGGTSSSSGSSSGTGCTSLVAGTAGVFCAQQGTSTTPLADTAIFQSGTTGNGELSEDGAAFSRVCTAANGVCPGGVSGGSNCTTATWVPFTLSSATITCSATMVYDSTTHRLSVGDRVGNPSAQTTIGELSGFAGIWFGSGAAGFGNYSLLSDGNYTYINAATGNSIELRVNNVTVGALSSTLHTSSVPISAPAYRTATNCTDSAGAAACGSAAAGAFVIDASGTSTVVSTTAVTATSRIFVFFDSSLGAALGITCNTTVPPAYGVSARTAATSFTLTATASVTNPACFSYFLVN